MLPADFLYTVLALLPRSAGTVIGGSVTFSITLSLMQMGKWLFRTKCVLLHNLQFVHCFWKTTSVLTGMPWTGRGRQFHARADTISRAFISVRWADNSAQTTRPHSETTRPFPLTNPQTGVDADRDRGECDRHR